MGASRSALITLGLVTIGLLAFVLLFTGNAKQERIAVLMQRCATAGFTEPQCTFLVALAERADSDEAFRRLLNDAAVFAH
jgi:hypothetical protein